MHNYTHYVYAKYYAFVTRVNPGLVSLILIVLVLAKALIHRVCACVLGVGSSKVTYYLECPTYDAQQLLTNWPWQKEHNETEAFFDDVSVQAAIVEMQQNSLIPCPDVY